MIAAIAERELIDIFQLTIGGHSMNTRKILRIIGAVMFIVAAVFVYCAVSCPTLGRVFYIGSIRIDAEIKRVFYACYVIVMVSLFIASFFCEKELITSHASHRPKLQVDNNVG